LRSFAEVVNDPKITGVIDQSDEGGRIPRNQWGLVRRALASVALKVLGENQGLPPNCIDAGWYQGNVKLIACEDERSAALYKAAIHKVGEVYPGAKLAVCEAADIPSRPTARVWLPSEPGAILSPLTRFNPKLPSDGWKVVKVEKTERVTMNQACLEPLAAQQNRVNYGFNNVQLRIYETDTQAADNLATCASYEPPSDDKLVHEEATLTGYVLTDSDLAESLKQLCTQDTTLPGRTDLQDIAEEAEVPRPTTVLKVVQFLQINPHHSKAASAALLTRVATGNIDVVLIQEPWIVGNNICGLSTPLYKLFYTKDKGKTRACILTKTHFNTILFPQFSEGDLTTVRLELNATLITP